MATQMVKNPPPPFFMRPGAINHMATSSMNVSQWQTSTISLILNAHPHSINLILLHTLFNNGGQQVKKFPGFNETPMSQHHVHKSTILAHHVFGFAMTVGESPLDILLQAAKGPRPNINGIHRLIALAETYATEHNKCRCPGCDAVNVVHNYLCFR